MRVARTAIYVSSLGFFGFGLWALIDPASMLAFVGLPDLPAAARAETRAFYGGMEIGFGLFLWWSARRDERLESALVASLAIFAGCAITRTLAMSWEGAWNFALVGSGAGEWAGAALNAWAWRKLRRG